MPVPVIYLVAILVYGTAYLTGCFIAGLITGNEWAWKLALMDMGVCYISVSLQVFDPQMKLTATALVLSTIVLGLAAGAALLVV